MDYESHGISVGKSCYMGGQLRDQPRFFVTRLKLKLQARVWKPQVVLFSIFEEFFLRWLRYCVTSV